MRGVFSGRFVLRTSLGAILALVLTVVVSSEGGPVSGPVPVPVAMTATPRVLVVGESLVRQVAGLEADDLRSAGFSPSIEARDSVTIRSDFVQAQVTRAVTTGIPIVVLETAANDAYQGVPIAARVGWPTVAQRFGHSLSSTLALLAQQCVVLVDTRDTATTAWYHLDQAGPPIDHAIVQVASEHHRGTVVVPWSTLSKGHASDWFWTDGLHFGDPSRGNADWHAQGARAFVDAVTAGVEACATKLRAHPAA